MNNYSVLQRFLHRIVLSSQLIREIMFDVDQSIFLKKSNIFPDEHVFVAGLARSGTTVLLNAIHQSNEFASLTYDDMPFVLAPNFWKKISFTKNHGEPKERAHGDGVRISTDSPEAFEEVFWKTFTNNSIISDELFIKFISLILKKNNKTRYLSKNNQNIRRLDFIGKIFPSSVILIPFRDPLQQAFSLHSQHMRFIKEQKKDSFVRNYMNWIGHSEFGLDYRAINSSYLSYPNEMELNHWLEQWYFTYNSILKLCDKYDQFYLIGYESLSESPNVWVNLKNLLDIDPGIQFSFKKIIKEIGPIYNKNLSDKCYKLHKSLISKSFGT
ncbi:sulfotransferase [Methylophilaceae bacterium]|nr:sulfotransferase [Methylophilaceae bacterium]